MFCFVFCLFWDFLQDVFNSFDWRIKRKELKDQYCLCKVRQSPKIGCVNVRQPYLNHLVKKKKGGGGSKGFSFTQQLPSSSFYLWRSDNLQLYRNVPHQGDELPSVTVAFWLHLALVLKVISEILTFLSQVQMSYCSLLYFLLASK